MRVVEDTAERLVTQDDATGWGAGFFGLAVSLIALAIGLDPSIHQAGPQIAMTTGALGAGVIGLRLARRTTARFSRRRGLISVTERRIFASHVREARLDEIQEVFVERSRGGHAGPSHRAALRVRGEVWPLATTFRDRKSALRLVEAVTLFLSKPF